MRSLIDTIQEGVPAPRRTESLKAYLTRLDLLDHGFGYRELVSRNPLSTKRRKPPRRYWQDFALALCAANELRVRAMAEASVKGIRVAAAFRPYGGARRSAHKKARALDLDRIGGDPREYFKCAVRFWCDYGGLLESGLGLYTWSATALGGIRVHLDVMHGCRSWQGIGGGFGRPYKIKGRRYGLPVSLAVAMGRDVPSLGEL